MKLPGRKIFALTVCLLACSPARVRCDDWSTVTFVGKWASDLNVRRHVAIAQTNMLYLDVLANMRTEESQAALLRIAYGEIGDWRAPQAAGKWSQNLISPVNARALLAARNLDVQKEGFRKLSGHPLDNALLAKASQALTNDLVQIREIIARLFLSDTNLALTEEKVRLISRSMKTTLACRDAGRLERSMENFCEDGLPAGEVALWVQAGSLGKMEGVTVGMIREHLGSETGVLHEFEILAIAYASNPAARVRHATLAERQLAQAIYATNGPAFFLGDIAARKQLHGVLRNSESLTARFAAISFLSWRPQREDIPVFEWVAANDSFISKPVDPDYFQMAGADQSLRGKKDATIYPLRFMAEQNLKRIREPRNQ